MTTALLMPEPEEPYEDGDGVRLVMVNACKAGKDDLSGRLIAVRDTAELRERFADEVAVVYLACHGTSSAYSSFVLRLADGSSLATQDLVRAAPPTRLTFLDTWHRDASALHPRGFTGPAYQAAMKALKGVLNRETEALDDFIETWLNRTPASHRLAVTNALLEEWWHNLNLADNDMVIKEIARRAQAASDALKPLWERQISGSRLEMLERPITKNGELCGTLADFANASRSVESHVLEYIDHQFPKVGDPCIDTVVATLTEVEARAVWAYAHEHVPWHEAALKAGAQSPEGFGATLAQKLRRAGRRHLKAAREAREAWEGSGRKGALSPPCRHWRLFESVQGAGYVLGRETMEGGLL
ncbi:hypothetical protein [Streptomyces sp. NPDC005485]|uniref:hypothetical protein n=1 Tax=Streptomyces sp. NPDC005485 TaxID=3155591 RepID=UPI0033A7AF64